MKFHREMPAQMQSQSKLQNRNLLRPKCFTSTVILAGFAVSVNPADLHELKSEAWPEEKVQWKKASQVYREGIWPDRNNIRCFTKHLFPFYAKFTPIKGHLSKRKMILEIFKYLFTKVFSITPKNVVIVLKKLYYLQIYLKMLLCVSGYILWNGKSKSKFCSRSISQRNNVRWGLPGKISIDNGSFIISSAIKVVENIRSLRYSVMRILDQLSV